MALHGRSSQSTCHEVAVESWHLDATSLSPEPELVTRWETTSWSSTTDVRLSPHSERFGFPSSGTRSQAGELHSRSKASKPAGNEYLTSPPRLSCSTRVISSRRSLCYGSREECWAKSQVAPRPRHRCARPVRSTLLGVWEGLVNTTEHHTVR